MKYFSKLLFLSFARFHSGQHLFWLFSGFFTAIFSVITLLRFPAFSFSYLALPGNKRNAVGWFFGFLLFHPTLSFRVVVVLSTLIAPQPAAFYYHLQLCYLTGPEDSSFLLSIYKFIVNNTKLLCS
jgi:hypothetical protein